MTKKYDPAAEGLLGLLAKLRFEKGVLYQQGFAELDAHAAKVKAVEDTIELYKERTPLLEVSS